MLAFIKTKGHKNESKLFKCLENAKTFWKVFLFWFLFIDLNVCVYPWQIKVNNSHLSISCILQLRINTLNHDKFLLYLELQWSLTNINIFISINNSDIVLHLIKHWTSSILLFAIRHILIPHTTEINSSIAFCRTQIVMKIILLTLHVKED